MIFCVTIMMFGSKNMSDAMPNNDKSKQEDNDPYNRLPHPEWVFYARIIGATIVGIGILIWFCSNIRDSKDYWTVLIGGAVSYLILMAMIVQIRVSKEQWGAMREQ